MKKKVSIILLLSLIFFTMSSCKLFPITYMVTSTEDNPNNPVKGTLRYALLNATEKDKIRFDTNVFPPENPATIYIDDSANLLPHIGSQHDHLTIDASNAGVILDGSHLSGEFLCGLQIVSTDFVTIRGLEITNFPGPAICLSGDSQNNTIVGNRITNNRQGVNLSTPETSNNTIKENYIANNTSQGITIYEGAHNNTIGPDNEIAYSGIQDDMDYGQIGFDLYKPFNGCGIYIQSNFENPEVEDSSGNLLTQNSIHNNMSNGICLIDDNGSDHMNRGIANGNIHAPYIFSVDMARGYVSGISCPKCTIEVFSSPNRDDAQYYEGQVVAQADSDGTFTFKGNQRFKYDYITVTATDKNNNTSEFARAAGLYNAAENFLQTGNTNPASLILIKPSYLLSENHIGVSFDNYDNGYYDTDYVYRNGFTRIRIQTLAKQYEDTWALLENIDPEVDATITEYADKGIGIELNLIAGSGVLIQYDNFDQTFQPDSEGNNPDLIKYKQYVSLVVKHFSNKDQISYYEILNGPWYISTKTYANVAKEIIPMIKNIDNGAKTTLSAESGSNGEASFYTPIDELFVTEITDENGISHLLGQVVDGLSWSSIGDRFPDDNYYQSYPQTVQTMQSHAVSYGFSGEYFGEYMLWSIYDEQNPNSNSGISNYLAAKYYSRAIVEERALGLNPTLNMFFQKPFMAPIANLCNVMAEAEPASIPSISIRTEENPFSPSREDANIRYYVFTSTDQDRLIAIWTNNEASDIAGTPNDVNTTITIPSLTNPLFTRPKSVTAIDVIIGIEQELNTETVNGNLVIRDLQVKDYPIILRFDY